MTTKDDDKIKFSSDSPACPVCGSTHLICWFEMQTSPVMKCAACQMIFMSLDCSVISYNDSYFSGADQKVDNEIDYQNYELEFPAHYRSFQHRLRETERLLGRKGRLLDVGCALGHCGKAAQDRGWDTYVTDVSPFSAQRAAEKFQLRSFVSMPGAFPVQNQSLDCVTLYGVIEHVSEPYSILKEIHRVLEPTGVLHLTTPDVRSLTARLMGRAWYHFKKDKHFLYFSQSTIRIALEKAGFEVLRLRPLTLAMRVRDVLERLKRYWKWGATKAIRVSELLGFAETIVQLRAGEMQVWARPKKYNDSTSTVITSALKVLVFKESNPLFCCPSCRTEVAVRSGAYVCRKCHAQYEIRAGVPDFSKPGTQVAKLDVA